MTLPAGCALANIPNCPGLVTLTGLPAGSVYRNFGFAIREVGLTFAPDTEEYVFIMANVGNAVGQYAIGYFIGACHPVSYDSKRVIAPSGPKSNAIPNTLAAPDTDGRGAELYATVAEATTWWGSLPNPKTHKGSGGFGQ